MQAGNKIASPSPPPSPSDVPNNGTGSSPGSPTTDSTQLAKAPDADVGAVRSKSEMVKYSCKDSFCAFWKTLLAAKAPSFLWCCCCCRHERRFLCSLASMATKAMNLILLFLVTFLSTLFIIPPNGHWDEIDKIAPAYYWPCGNEKGDGIGSKENFEFFKVLGFWGDCRGHAGYFFVYRFFFCLVVFYTIMSVVTFNVTSTKTNSLRSALHRGFWCYKFIIIGALMLIACLAIRVYSGGAFEYVMMWTGLLGTYFFAFMEMVCALDALELLLNKAKNSLTPMKYKIFYWTLTGVSYAAGFVSIVVVGLFNTKRNYFDSLDRTKGAERHFFDGVDIDFGKNHPTHTLCALHIGLMIYDVFVGLLVTILIVLVKKFRSDHGHRFPHLGFLHAALMFLYTVFQSWSAISNSTDIECRYVSFPYNAYEKNKDVTFTPQGLVNGLIATFAILYYTFANGVKTKAPWSVAFNKVWHLASGAPRESADTTPEPLRSWNDEKTNVTYSWPLYYITLILGSLSLMMAMTNYANPHAASAAAGNEAALAVKMLATASCVLFFMIPIMKGCRTISPDAEGEGEQKTPDELAKDAATEEVNLSGQVSPGVTGSREQVSQEQSPLPSPSPISPAGNSPAPGPAPPRSSKV